MNEETGLQVQFSSLLYNSQQEGETDTTDSKFILALLFQVHI